MVLLSFCQCGDSQQLEGSNLSVAGGPLPDAFSQSQSNMFVLDVSRVPLLARSLTSHQWVAMSSDNSE